MGRMNAAANEHATHADASGLPVAFSPGWRGEEPSAYHPTPCCGAAASISDGPMYCKACYHEVADWYGDVPQSPFTVLEGRAGDETMDTVGDMLESLHGLAKRPVAGYPKTLALTVSTDETSSRRGFLAIIDIADPDRHSYCSFASIEGRDPLDVAADALDTCRSVGAMRCVDEDGNDIEVADLIAKLQANHPPHRVLDDSMTLGPGNVHGVYEDLDGRRWRAQSMYMHFTLNDAESGREGDWVARDVTDSPKGGPVQLIPAERFEIEFTLVEPGML